MARRGYPKGGQLPRAERFWGKVDKNGPIPVHVPELGPCWPWTGNIFAQRGGYGQFYDDDRRVRRAHRVAWELATGQPLSEDTMVLHRCDLPRCVRPSHLREGSQAENLQDMRDKGRGTIPPAEHGEERYNAKLTDDRVRTLRAVRAAGGSVTALAKEWGVSQACAASAAVGRSWKHVV
jgi:hypothetical protein